MATGGIVAAGAVTKVFVDGMQPTQVVRDAHRRIADISGLQPGQSLQIEYREQPVIIYRRTEEQLRELQQSNEDLLDPHSEGKHQPAYAKNPFRSIKPEFFIAHPVCTHLSCALKHQAPEIQKAKDRSTPVVETADWRGGFICPCHAALFDMAGRVYKNKPAQSNLLIPEHRYINDGEIEFTITEG